MSSGGSNYSSSNLKGSYEVTALTSDPQFVNTGNLPTGFTGTYGSSLAPNNNGLSLQSSSPGINSGVALWALRSTEVSTRWFVLPPAPGILGPTRRDLPARRSDPNSDSRPNSDPISDTSSCSDRPEGCAMKNLSLRQIFVP